MDHTYHTLASGAITKLTLYVTRLTRARSARTHLGHQSAGFRLDRAYFRFQRVNPGPERDHRRTEMAFEKIGEKEKFSLLGRVHTRPGVSFMTHVTPSQSSSCSSGCNKMEGTVIADYKKNVPSKHPPTNFLS